MTKKRNLEVSILRKYLELKGMKDIQVEEKILSHNTSEININAMLSDMICMQIKGSESPDFITTLNDNVIGIEITEDTNESEQLTHKFASGKYDSSKIDKISKGKVKRIFPNTYQPQQSSLIDYNQMIKTTIDKINLIKNYKFCDKYIIIVWVSNPLKDPSSINLSERLNIPNNVTIVFLWNDYYSKYRFIEVGENIL